ncbi:18698_t:CDS:2 [Dentiscutata erythropus]|uniref:18698_t:CDS:1 n=1 Tax=Dentiscutata erythropus TaxID=1348616 RepID=A0A9N9F638_9GLOM|nr:18698_t:CDS:2 [Dentiscutata erythropus]
MLTEQGFDNRLLRENWNDVILTIYKINLLWEFVSNKCKT